MGGTQSPDCCWFWPRQDQSIWWERVPKLFHLLLSAVYLIGLGSGKRPHSRTTTHPTRLYPCEGDTRSQGRGEPQLGEREDASARKLPGTQHRVWERRSQRQTLSITATLYYQSLHRLSPLPEVSRTRVEPGSDEVGEGRQSSPRPRESLGVQDQPGP